MPDVCTYCAGVGRLATQVLKFFQGVCYRQPITIRTCDVCDGTGVRPNFRSA